MTEVVRLRQGHSGYFLHNDGLRQRSGSLVERRKRTTRWIKPSRLRQNCSNCLHTIDRLGTDLKITPTWLTGYARLGGEADGGLRKVWGTRGPVRELYHPPPSPDPGNCDEETLRRIRRSDGR